MILSPVLCCALATMSSSIPTLCPAFVLQAPARLGNLLWSVLNVHPTVKQPNTTAAAPTPINTLIARASSASVAVPAIDWTKRPANAASIVDLNKTGQCTRLSVQSSLMHATFSNLVQPVEDGQRQCKSGKCTGRCTYEYLSYMPGDPSDPMDSGTCRVQSGTIW